MGDIFATIEEKKAQFDEWLKTQPAAYEVAITSATSALQGGVLGYVLGSVNQSLEKQAASMGNKPPTMAGSFSGPPKVLALNLAVFTAVQGGLTLAIKKIRGVDDIYGSMGGMFGAGMALSVCTNLSGGVSTMAPGQVRPTTAMGYATDAVRTGVLFALLNGAFMKVGQWFSGKDPEEDIYYVHTVGMLSALGLEKYEKNFRRGLLTDDCLTLLNDSALAEVKIPPGPRLKILNYVAASRAQMMIAQQQYLEQQQGAEAMSLALPAK